MATEVRADEPIRALYRTLLLPRGRRGRAAPTPSPVRELRRFRHDDLLLSGLAGVFRERKVGLLIRAMVNDAAAHRIVAYIGARGRERSNSFDLLRHFGWKGLPIEANPAPIEDIGRTMNAGAVDQGTPAPAPARSRQPHMLCTAIGDHARKLGRLTRLPV
jgi:hypothetical protein